MNKNLLLAAACVTALFLTACGGGESSSSSASADPEKAANLANYECTADRLEIRMTAAANSGDMDKLEEAAAFEKKCRTDKLGKWNPEMEKISDGLSECGVKVGMEIISIEEGKKCRAPFEQQRDALLAKWKASAE